MSRTILLGGAAALALLLAGCGHSPPTRFFTLDAAAPEALASAAYAGPPLRVDSVQPPPALDRPELVRETAANELRVDDFAHWGGPLGELARRALTQDLAARLPQGAVIYPDAPKPQGGLGLAVDLLAVTPGAATVTLDAGWTLSDAHGRVVATHSERLTTPAAGADPADDAAALSRLLGRLADRIAATIAASPPAASSKVSAAQSGG